MTIMKPMLAGKCSDITKLKYPVLATPKIDGIRCLIIRGGNGDPKAVSRNFKPIPNNYVRGWLENHCAVGFDGELVAADGNFQQTSSAIMSRSGTPSFEYRVFDYYYGEGDYERRVDKLIRIWEQCAMEHNQFPAHNYACKLILPEAMYDVDQLEEYEALCLSEGFEGVMVRDPKGPYKFGRSTEREGYLLKIKRFEDGEAVVVGVEEKMHNSNGPMDDPLGRTRRHSFKEGMVPMNTLGALLVKDCKTGVEFRIGTGFDDALRQTLWNARATLNGTIVKYKSQPTGVKDKPRFPVFLGIRSELCQSQK